MGTPEPIPFEGQHSEDDLELFGPYRYLYPIDVEGDRFLVPERNYVLRALQYVEIKHRAVRLPYWDYCWNNTVGCCEMTYRASPEEPEQIGRACRVEVQPGMQIVKLPKGGRRCAPKR